MIEREKPICTGAFLMNPLCEFAWKQPDLPTSWRLIITRPWLRPVQRSAGNSRSRVTNQRDADNPVCASNTRRQDCLRHNALKCCLGIGRKLSDDDGWLGRQPFDPPRFAFAGIAETIMQAVGATLPKLD